ncbi:MAG: type II toxin-antitoxin system RelE/ParE family toxin [Phycisphaerales bacterium]|nr:type II toxin-antitoxin system RelE/ParE family toxin [Phycisphaerales bacterium]
MKPCFRFSNLAAEGLNDIWDYIALDDPLAADAFIDELHGKFQMLSENPRMGRQRDDLAPGLRSFPHGNYVITYRIKHDIIEIDRVIHGARDLYSAYHSNN